MGPFTFFCELEAASLVGMDHRGLKCQDVRHGDMHLRSQPLWRG
jgi:hypothetical protein